MSPAETLGAGMALSRVIRQPTDVRPDLKGGWAWSAEREWPPLTSILKAPLWDNEVYRPHREMLLRATPKPAVEEGGSFITLLSLIHI